MTHAPPAAAREELPRARRSNRRRSSTKVGPAQPICVGPRVTGGHLEFGARPIRSALNAAHDGRDRVERRIGLSDDVDGPRPAIGSLAGVAICGRVDGVARALPRVSAAAPGGDAGSSATATTATALSTRPWRIGGRRWTSTMRSAPVARQSTAGTAALCPGPGTPGALTARTPGRTHPCRTSR